MMTKPFNNRLLKRSALVALAALALSGCKIQLVSNEGGSISTSSGAYQCQANESCAAVNVSDIHFDETFVATADAGYEFTGWKVRDRGLCGGKKDDCRLFTAGFAGNATLMGFLENDQTFYLEAEFAPLTSSPAEGLWVGTTSEGRSIRMLVLDDGSYYFIYSPSDDSQSVAGVITGQSSTQNGAFSSSKSIEFSRENPDLLAPSISAKIDNNGEITGTITHTTGSPISFEASYSDKYEDTPNLNDVAKAYGGDAVFSGGFSQTTFVVYDDGEVTGKATFDGCAFTGNLTPHESGNVYDISFKFRSQSCLYYNETLEGVAYYDALANWLYVVAPKSDRTDGFLYFGKALN